MRNWFQAFAFSNWVNLSTAYAPGGYWDVAVNIADSTLSSTPLTMTLYLFDAPSFCNVDCVVGLCTLNSFDPYPITYSLSNP
jgi:hypothetical protein